MGELFSALPPIWSSKQMPLVQVGGGLPVGQNWGAFGPRWRNRSTPVKSFTKDRLCVSMCVSSAPGRAHSPVLLSPSSMGMGSETQHISECQTSVRDSERVSRLGVTSFSRLEQMATLSRDVSFIDASSRALCHRSVCGPTERSITPFLNQLETGSDGPCHGCPSSGLVGWHTFSPLA
jgi:hypothetical protein